MYQSNNKHVCIQATRYEKTTNTKIHEACLVLFRLGFLYIMIDESDKKQTV